MDMNEAGILILLRDRQVNEYLLQDLPNFLVEADWDSVQRSVQTPPAEPLAVSGICDAGEVIWNIQGLNGRQPVPLNGSKREREIKTAPLAKGLQNGRARRDLHRGLDVFNLQRVGPHALRGREGTGRRGDRRRVQHENLTGQKSSAAAPLPPRRQDSQVLVKKAAFSWNY